MKAIRCLLGLHLWKDVYESGPRIVQECERCHALRSSVYDIIYGHVRWIRGDHWRL